MLQAAALRRRRALQRQVLYTKPVTAQAGQAIQVQHAFTHLMTADRQEAVAHAEMTGLC